MVYIGRFAQFSGLQIVVIWLSGGDGGSGRDDEPGTKTAAVQRSVHSV